MKKINKIGAVVIIGILLALMLTPSWVAPPDPDWNTGGNLGDSTDFLGTTNDEDLRIKTNNAQVMVIESGGNVGIGTASPSNTLSVDGDADISQKLLVGRSGGGAGILVVYGPPTDSLDASVYFQDDNTGSTTSDGLEVGVDEITIDGFIWHYESKNLSFGTSGTDRMRILSGGNVGIGTTTPDYELQVDGTIAPETTDYDLGTSSLRWDLYANTINGDSNVTLTGLVASTDNTVLILDINNEVRQDEIDSRVWDSTLFDGSGSAGHVAYWSDRDTLTYDDQKFYWDATNNELGIGTAAPLSELTIHGGDDENDATLTWDVDGQDWYMGVDDSYGDKLIIGMDSTVGTKPRFTIDPIFNHTGINIADPNYELHIHNYYDHSRLQLTHEAIGHTKSDGFKIMVESAGEVQLRNTENTKMDFWTNDAVRMTIKSTGVINIGSLPTSSGGLVGGDLYSQTDIQLWGSGTGVKVVCIV